MDIYAHPEKGKWQSEIISRFDANQTGFCPKWKLDVPEAKLVMRLRINDLILVKGQIMRVQKLSGKEIALALHSEANVDQRNRDKDDALKFVRISVSSLQKDKAVKIYISPTGLISAQTS